MVANEPALEIERNDGLLVGVLGFLRSDRSWPASQDSKTKRRLGDVESEEKGGTRRTLIALNHLHLPFQGNCTQV